VSQRTIQRPHDRNVRIRKQSFTDKYKHKVTRNRVDQRAENIEAEEIVKTFLPVQFEVKPNVVLLSNRKLKDIHQSMEYWWTLSK
jgi:hypothetical protein